jgi:hypothetical protein
MPISISTMMKDQRIIRITMLITLIMGKEMMIPVGRKVCHIACSLSEGVADIAEEANNGGGGGDD